MTYALIGAAGYVAPRHMKAIYDTGGKLVAAIDPHDSVGILDSYFPDCDFFTEFERFDRHLDMLNRSGRKVDFLVICSPNYLHDAHCRYGLRNNMNVICEKPLTINNRNEKPLRELENKTGRSIHVVYQLRHHPSIIDLHQKVLSTTKEKYQVQLQYHTPRGNWYHHSWKGDHNKSGGIVVNIGTHFFDMLEWIFGGVIDNTIHHQSITKAVGVLRLEKAIVDWDLSIEKAVSKKRSLFVNNKEVDFTHGFEDLHTQWYHHLLVHHNQ